MAEVLQERQFLTEDLKMLQADFEKEMVNPPYEIGATQLAEMLKQHDKAIEEAEKQVRDHQRQREEPLKKYQKKLTEFSATLPDKDPFYAASYYMDGRFDGTWESHNRNSGNMLEYWHNRGMFLASLNAFLMQDVQPVFMIDVATTEMGGERNIPLTSHSRNRGLVKNKFVGVVGRTASGSPMEIVDDVKLDAATGARILRPSKVMLNVEIDDLIVSPNWPTHDMGNQKPKAGVRTINEQGVLQVPILEAPFPSIGRSANAHLGTELGSTSIFGTSDVAVGPEYAKNYLLSRQQQYVDGIKHDEPTWDAIRLSAELQGIAV